MICLIPSDKHQKKILFVKVSTKAAFSVIVGGQNFVDNSAIFIFIDAFHLKDHP